MWNTFKYTVISLMREKNVLIWALAFPLVLATIFNFMFANLDEASNFEPIAVAVVKDQAYEDSHSFSQMIEVVSEEGEDQFLKTTFVSSSEEAHALLKEQAIEGYLTIDDAGKPSYHVGTISSSMSSEKVNRTIVKNLLDTYLQYEVLITGIVEENPRALEQMGSVNELVKSEDFTAEIWVTDNEPSQTVRYFYALLGFSAIMASTIGLVAISATLSGTSALGARRNVGATSKATTLIATLLASWLLSFCCVLLGYLFIKYVFGVNFGDKDVACILAIAVASLVSTALGTFVGSFRLSEGAKAGIMTGLCCFLALFAGLYGEASMQLADELSRTAPVLQMINPSKQIADIFYSLYYYDTYTQYFSVLITLLITAGVLFVAAAVVIRRQRHASL
ncbi:MAG: ABC transporter permease [Raoultibacter sp.]|jgi:ABC-2 type transport system permease protein